LGPLKRREKGEAGGKRRRPSGLYNKEEGEEAIGNALVSLFAAGDYLGIRAGGAQTFELFGKKIRQQQTTLCDGSLDSERLNKRRRKGASLGREKIHLTSYLRPTNQRELERGVV